MIFKVINLERRTDRWESFVSHAEDVGIEYERYCAIEPTDAQMEGIKLRKGLYGCNLSHLSLWQQFLDTSEPYLGVLEDDARQVRTWDRKLPKSFDLFYLGCNDRTSGARPGINQGKYHKVKRVLTTHAYIISRAGAEKAVRLDLQRYAIDVALWKIHQLNNSYYFKPSRFIQNPDYSDILNTQADYTYTI